MRYPFYRLVSLLALCAITSLAWLWVHSTPPQITHQAEITSERPLDVQGLKIGEAVVRPSIEARRRPLFTPGRKPFVPSLPPPPIPTPPPITVVELAAQPSPSPKPPPQALDPSDQTGPRQQAGIAESGLQLKGIAINDGARSALVISPQLPSGQWLKQGEKIAGWEIVAIEKNHVFLKLGNTSAKMQLYVDNSAN
jgi:hypothetical protein